MIISDRVHMITHIRSICDEMRKHLPNEFRTSLKKASGNLQKAEEDLRRGISTGEIVPNEYEYKYTGERR